ncbi:MAG: hypothetical protein ABH872_02640 [Candidatus Omnitrophota bacterium]
MAQDIKESEKLTEAQLESQSNDKDLKSQGGVETNSFSRQGIIAINQSEKDAALFSIELRDAELVDLFRVLAHDYNLNIMADKAVEGKVTASLTNISLNEALLRIADLHNLIIEEQGNVLVVKPNLKTKVFILKHVEAKILLNQSVFSNQTPSNSANLQASSPDSSTTGQAQQEKKEANIYDLLSDQGKVLLGTQPNSLLVIDYPDNLKKIDIYISTIDKGMASRIFKLKYISAQDIVKSGQKNTVSSETKEVTAQNISGQDY